MRSIRGGGPSPSSAGRQVRRSERPAHRAASGAALSQVNRSQQARCGGSDPVRTCFWGQRNRFGPERDPVWTRFFITWLPHPSRNLQRLNQLRLQPKPGTFFGARRCIKSISLHHSEILQPSRNRRRPSHLPRRITPTSRPGDASPAQALLFSLGIGTSLIMGHWALVIR